MAEPATNLGDEELGQTEEQKAAEAFAQVLDQIADLLIAQRTEAVRGRNEMGIEYEWDEDEEFYEGIDDVNRTDMWKWRRQKPTPGGAIGPETEKSKDTRSTVFPNITRPYTDAASARVGDMLHPTDDKAWSIRPTPIPEMLDLESVKLTQSEQDEIDLAFSNEPESPEREQAIVAAKAERLKKKVPRLMRDQISEDVRSQPQFEEMRTQGKDAAEIEAAAAQVEEKAYVVLADEIEAKSEEGRHMAKLAEKQIEDWHVEGGFVTHHRETIDNCARLGTGVLKGPIPKKSKIMAYKDGALVTVEEMKPVSVAVNVRNCFPDPGCGNNVHNGQYHWERDDITEVKITELLTDPTYLKDQIIKVLDQGPHVVVSELNEDMLPGYQYLSRRDLKHLFEIWYGYSFLKKSELEELGVPLPESMEDKSDHELLPVAVQLVNNTIIKIASHHLDSGEFPYDYLPWQRRDGVPYGIGIPRQMRVAQRIYTAATRNMMDNAGLAGGPMFLWAPGLIEPMDGQNEIRPRKMWRVNPEILKDNPRLLEYAIRFIELPTAQPELMAIQDMGKTMAEDVTGQPAMMQGQLGSAPDTVGGMTMLNNNASTVMRRIARLADDNLTGPHVRRYYSYLLQYGKDDAMKGDLQVQARGSSALVERDLNSQAIAQMGVLVQNPAYGIDPKKYSREWLLSQRLVPSNFEFDDDTWQETIQGLYAQSQKGDSSVEVAQIRAEIERMKLEATQNMRTAELALDKERFDFSKIIEMYEKEQDQQMAIATAALKRESEQNDIVMTDKQIQAKLAETVMNQDFMAWLKQLDGTEVPGFIRPPVEPPGRAADDKAFTQ